MEAVVTVLEVTRRIKGNLEGDPGLRGVRVRGELSNFKIHTSGHAYFTLKDRHSALRCVMFRSRRAYLSLLCRDGDAVIATGSLGVYERDGLYQLYVESLVRDGTGDLREEFERLKARLEAEGLFDPSRKRRIPRLSRRVGVVTSPTGAALRDVVSVGRRRFPKCRLVIAPVLVQGEAAPASIASAILTLNQIDDIDVIIVGRGGGSQEELAAFNTEEVARAVFSSTVPVISAVGHETDFTIADLVADARAPTPSAAAEMAFPDRFEIERHLGALSERMGVALTRRHAEAARHLASLAGRPVLSRPLEALNQVKQEVDELSSRLQRAFSRIVEKKTAEARELYSRLDALSPLAVLSRGYSVCLILPGREVLRSVREVKGGDRLSVVLKDGEVHCTAVESLPHAGEREGDG